MKILVYDYVFTKIGAVTELIGEQYPEHTYDVVVSLKDAQEAVGKRKYQMIIADLETPVSRRQGEVDKNSGIIFLQYIFQSEGENFFRPDEIVVLTKYADDKELINNIKKFPVSIIMYQERGEEWKIDLSNRIYDCNKKYENKVDIAIMTAVEVEFKAFYNMEEEWEEKSIENESNIYYISCYENKTRGKVKVLLTMLPDMGMVPAADATHRIINLFHPDCIIMSGICGGNKKDVSAGDIVVAEKAWDYGSGSMEENIDQNGERLINFIPAPEQISVDKMITKEFRQYALDDNLKINIRQKCKMSKFDRDIKIKIGGMATGAAVIKNEEFVQKYIKPTHRKYLGIDMETYGLYYAAEHFVNSKMKFVSIKSVSDGADAAKSDEFQEYCAKLSANLTNYFIENVPYDILTK